MVRHRLALVAAVAVVAVECAGTPTPKLVAPVAAEADEPTADPATEPARDVTAAPPDARVPQAAPDQAAPAPLPPTVEPIRPDVRVDGVPADAADRLGAVEGVQDAVTVGSVQVQASTPAGLQPVDALVVDVHEFRRFTPDVTANEVGVWQRLDEGDIVFTAAKANELEATLGETTTLSGPRGTEALRVGALAANGLPQLADVLVPEEVGERLGAATPDTLFVAVGEDADPDAVLAAVVEAVGGEGAVLEEPAVQRQAAPGIGATTIEPFSYQSVGDGTIRIDPDWVARHIVSVDMPIIGRVTCHRAIIDQMYNALVEIEAAGLAGEIYQYSGCWVPRHMLWDPSRGISQHAWGLAFDINVPTNQYGATPTLHPGIVDAFRRWGFTWGGDFSTPDGMHFELERVIQP